MMLDDLNDIEVLRRLCAVLLGKTGGRARVTSAELEASKGMTIRTAPANEKGDEVFVSLEKEPE
jgi:hypothetical protein